MATERSRPTPIDAQTVTPLVRAWRRGKPGDAGKAAEVEAATVSLEDDGARVGDRDAHLTDGVDRRVGRCRDLHVHGWRDRNGVTLDLDSLPGGKLGR